MTVSYDCEGLGFDATYRVDDAKDIGVHLHVEVVLELRVGFLGGGEVGIEVVSLFWSEVCAVDEEIIELVAGEFANFGCGGLERFERGHIGMEELGVRHWCHLGGSAGEADDRIGRVRSKVLDEGMADATRSAYNDEGRHGEG